MSRNIVIFSDGTGQRGGLRFDERRSNIYKLYRATRCGPDSSVPPSKQTAFYDPGLGTRSGGKSLFGAIWELFYNLVSQATGMGITKNIEDCYAAILRDWQPANKRRKADRIFLFGFSRGAYTVRCLGGVLKLCGIPQAKGDEPLKYDPKSIRKLAKEAVHIYNYTNSRPENDRTDRQAELLKHRDLLAAEFRKKYHCDGEDGGNARPYFIGVFDTVASLSNWSSIFLLMGLMLAVVLAAAGAANWAFEGGFVLWTLVLSASTAFTALVCNLLSRLRWAPKLDGVPWHRTVHITTARMKMYDTDLDTAVRYARHAISIDETRAAFPRVRWGQPGVWKEGTPTWFAQIWFAGNHSDIGGSYPENESRLSDITLKWMLDSAHEVGLVYDPSVLRPYPDALGMQHDESKVGIFKHARKKKREPVPEATLHRTVLERFEADSVRHFDEDIPYRPEGLRDHEQVSHYYKAGSAKGPDGSAG